MLSLTSIAYLSKVLAGSGASWRRRHLDEP